LTQAESDLNLQTNILSVNLVTPYYVSKCAEKLLREMIVYEPNGRITIEEVFIGSNKSWTNTRGLHIYKAYYKVSMLIKLAILTF